MRYKKSNLFSMLLKPFSIMLLIVGLFSVLWLRSNIVSLEYGLSNLDKKKITLMREKKMLMAERAHLLSIERFQKLASTGSGFIVPDRVRVVSVKRMKGGDTYKVSLQRAEQQQQK
jgi:hypothetical protein